MQIGESFVGSGANAAHINTVLGRREGPVGTAWATGLATPSDGHAPFVAVLRPGLPVKPPTLFVNKAKIAGDEHAHMTWGAAQAGVAGGVADAVAAGVFSGDGARLDDLVLIVAVWVDPAADDDGEVYRNNREATFHALTAGARLHPKVEDILDARAQPWNPFFRS